MNPLVTVGYNDSDVLVEIQNGMFTDYMTDCRDYYFPDISDFSPLVGNTTHDLYSDTAHEALCHDHVQPVKGIPIAFFVENQGTIARMKLKSAAGTFRARHAWHYNELTQDDAGYSRVFTLSQEDDIARQFRESYCMWGLS